MFTGATDFEIKGCPLGIVNTAPDLEDEGTFLNRLLAGRIRPPEGEEPLVILAKLM